MRYGIGIDTGGTYTDSVVVDFVSNRIISKSKALTTRQDLRIGILNSIAGLDESLFPEVRLVALSTTLATNSVVEGKGQRVGLIMAVPNPATFQVPSGIPADQVVVIRGACDRTGKETVPLDIVSGREAIQRLQGCVDAFAVSGYFSIYNPDHELKLKACIAEECPLPVICGHELTGAVGMVERAVTAAFNARLLPVISELLSSVVEILEKKGIDAHLMVVRGDGSLVSEYAARSRPVETILSGPAASLIGARWLTGLDDALIVDMGGTTTDIGILAGAMPRVSEDGANIGGWQTRVRSIELWTIGLGGDSRITIDSDASIQIGPRRSEPLSHAGSRYPQLREKIEQLSSVEGYGLKDIDLDFYTLIKRPSFEIEKQERLVLDALDGSLLHRSEIDRLTGPWVDLNRFTKQGFVAEVSFTPTDLLHCTGALSLWDREVCESAIFFYSVKTGLNREQLLLRIFDEILHLLTHTIASTSLSYEGLVLESSESGKLLSDILRLDGQSRISASFKLKKPLIAVGAPAKAYFPPIASKLGAELVIPADADVANAAGAVTGRVMASAEVFVRPVRPTGFSIVPGDQEKIYDAISEAVDFAKSQAYDLALMRAEEIGGAHINVTVNAEEVRAPIATGIGKTLLLEVRVAAVAVGEPCF